MGALTDEERLRAETAPLYQQRRRRRRLSSACFFIAGVGFGTALYLLRARFDTLRETGKSAALVALVTLMVLAFWLGARAETEVGQLDERIRELEERAARPRPGAPT
jgi:hypothetical protein